MTADTADRLTPDQQAQAVSQWGRAGSFRCCACGAESDVQAPATVRTDMGMQMGTCRPCALRLQYSPTYRRETRARANEAAQRAVFQRVADLVGVTGAALLDAFRGDRVGLMLGTLPTAADVARAELRLNVPPGSLSGALLQVFGVRPHQ